MDAAALTALRPGVPERLQGNDGGVESLGFGMLGGGILVVVWLAVLVVVLVLARTKYEHGDGPLNWFEVFYRTGSIIYGGGQVRRHGRQCAGWDA
jgi:chromate transporter